MVRGGVRDCTIGSFAVNYWIIYHPQKCLAINTPLHSYGTAMLDLKRRQGFLRSLIDFQSAHNGIQKKHMIMNYQQLVERAKKRGRMNKCLSKYNIPLLLSSGSRQNYTLGTGDEGTLALRSPQDVKCLILHLAGVGEVEVEVDSYADDSNGGTDIIDHNKRKKHKERKEGAISAAERILARARSRVLGKVTISGSGVVASVHNQSFARDNDHVKSSIDTLDDNEDDEEGEEEDNRGFSCVIDWLSAPLRRKRKSTEAMKDDDGEEKPAPTPPVNDVDHASSKAPAVHTLSSSQPERNSLDGEHDLEDGFIAM